MMLGRSLFRKNQLFQFLFPFYVSHFISHSKHVTLYLPELQIFNSLPSRFGATWSELTIYFIICEQTGS